jgi:RimJ/RimL family protein N-acetyltransferase
MKTHRQLDSPSYQRPLPGAVYGEKIVLKEIAPAHFDETFAWLKSRRLRRELVITRYPYTKKETTRWYDAYRNNPFRFIYVAFLKGTDIAVGQIGFNRIDRTHRNGEIHIFIGEAENYGKGYAREMLGMFIKIAFEKLNLVKIWLKVNDDNIRAIRFYEKMGFVKEGHLKHHEIFDDELLSKYVYSYFSHRESS